MRHSWENYTCRQCGLRKQIRGGFYKTVQYVNSDGTLSSKAGECNGNEVIEGPDENAMVIRTSYEVLDSRGLFFLEVRTQSEAEDTASLISGRWYKIRRRYRDTTERQLTLKW